MSQVALAVPPNEEDDQSVGWFGFSVRRPALACSAFIVVSVAGCTGPSSSISTSTPSASAVQQPSVLPALSSSDHGSTNPGSAVASAQHVVITPSKSLNCSDSTRGYFESKGSLVAGDVVFEGLATPGDPPPTVAYLKMNGVAGPMANWHFRKVVLYVKPNVAGRFTITVDHADQALAWLPADKWGTAGLDIAQWASRSTTIAGCGASTSSRYLGGIWLPIRMPAST